MYHPINKNTFSKRTATEAVLFSFPPKLEKIIENYIKGIDLDNNNIHLEKDYLISSGTPTTQNTWMDAKYGDFAATPRNGKAVEVNSLWYYGLMIMTELSKKFGKSEEAKQYEKLAKKCKKTLALF